MLKFYCEEAGRALAELKSTPDGLTDAEAARRLAEKGPNKLAEGKKVTTLQRFLQQLSDPMIIILLVAAAVSGVTAAYSGESFADVFIILIVVLINAVLGVYQESKAEKAIEALQEMTAATSKVIRGGKQVSLKSEELVPGDVVVLEAGDAVPADGRILESASLKIEEAALTGESVPVNKVVSALGLDDGKDVPLGDRKNMAYMGSTVVYGRGRVLITGTGMDTEMGKIAGALAQAEEGQTPLQKKLAQLSKILSWLVLGICVFIFAFSLIKAGDFHHGSGQSCRRGHPRGPCHRRYHRTLHRRNEHVQAQCRHPPPYGCGDAGLRTGHLLGQNRYADAEQDDGCGARG